MTEREFAVGVVRKLREAGYEAYFAGGCVRDELLGLTPDDHDVATSARPEEVRRLFRRTIPVGASFGVIEVVGPRTPDGRFLTVEVATFRTEGPYSDGRRPDSVTYSSAEEDAKRRDFTINGMFLDPLRESLEEGLIDYVGGREDLRAGVVRAIGDPFERLAEDKLRMLRAVRIATRFGFRLDPATKEAIRAMAPQIGVVSAERVADELRKMLAHPRRADAVRLLDEVGLLTAIAALGDPKARAGERWEHVLRMLEALPESASFPLALAVLLHPAGAGAVGDAARGLRLSNAERDRVEWLVRHFGALRDAPTMPPSRLYPLLTHPGIGELLALHRADAVAAGADAGHVAFCEQILRTTPPERLNPPPLLTGDDLKAAGLKPGPEFKRLLDAVRRAQLDGEVTTGEEALALALKLHAADGGS